MDKELLLYINKAMEAMPKESEVIQASVERLGAKLPRVKPGTIQNDPRNTESLLALHRQTTLLEEGLLRDRKAVDALIKISEKAASMMSEEVALSYEEAAFSYYGTTYCTVRGRKKILPVLIFIGIGAAAYAIQYYLRRDVM
jgi:hypothetical protein